MGRYFLPAWRISILLLLAIIASELAIQDRNLRQVSRDMLRSEDVSWLKADLDNIDQNIEETRTLAEGFVK